MIGGSYTDAVTTGADGLATFTVEAGEYTLSASSGNGLYTYTASEVTIAGNDAGTITMTQREIPAPTEPTVRAAATARAAVPPMKG